MFPKVWQTRAGAEIDLIVDRGEERIGYEFKCASSVTRGDTSGLKAGLADGVITRGHVVYPGDRSYPLTERIDATPAQELLSHYHPQRHSASAGEEDCVRVCGGGRE